MYKLVYIMLNFQEGPNMRKQSKNNTARKTKRNRKDYWEKMYNTQSHKYTQIHMQEEKRVKEKGAQ